MTHIQPHRTAVDYLIAARQAETRSLRHLLRMARLVVTISSLVHAVQRERGASGIFAGSTGQRFHEQRERLMADTDHEIRALDALLGSMDGDTDMLDAGNRLLSRMAGAMHQISLLAAFRHQVGTLQSGHEEIFQFYTELIRSLLAIVFEAADTATDPDITRALVALFHFMQGKELAGQERALGCLRLASGQFSSATVERAGMLVDGQERCFETFSHFADDVALDLWRDAAAPCSLDEIGRLRAIIAMPSRNRDRDGELSEQWFDACTRRIDAMKQVEDALEHNVERTSEIRLAAAQRDLDLYRRDAMELKQLEALTVLPQYSGNEPADALTPALGRSIIDLLQSQTQRLQSMQEELERARAALDERKLVNQAKALLMKHRHLPEDEAYALMRKMAMNQNRRLVEIARTVLAMADMLK